MILRGPQSLSDSELLAILLRTGAKGLSVIEVAQNLVKEHGSLVGLAGQSVATLSKQTGIGKDKAATLVAAFELTRRIDFNKRWFSNTRITSPQDVADIFIPLMRDETKEVFIVVCLNSSNQIIKFEKITVGLLNSSMVHAREVFKVAIENNSANIILLHNHPSGNIEPSAEDIKITSRLVEAGTILDITVFDHIIIAHDKYLSMVERKLI